MIRRSSPTLLGALSLAILITLVVGGPAAETAFAFLAALFPVALMLLGIEKNGRLGAAMWPVLLLAALLVASIAGMLVFRGQVVGAPRVLGLPPAAAIQIIGLFVLPLAVVALGFAWTFRGFGPTRDELERLRSVAAESRRS